MFALDPGRLARELAGAGPAGGGAPGNPAEDTQEDASPGGLEALLGVFRPVRVGLRDGITARFNRDPVHPGAGFQFGWGSNDDFRFLDGDTAATLVDERTWTASSGMALPGGMTVDVAYQRTDAATLDTRSDRTVLQRSWPDLRVGLPPMAPPPSVGIQRVTLSSGYRRNAREIVYGGLGQQRRDQSDVQIPVNVSVTWVGDLVTSYRASFRDGTSADPTGTTENDERSHRISVTSQFRPPLGLSSRLDRPVRLSLVGSYIAERDCRATASQEACVPFVDQLRRSVSVSLDTSAGGMEVGLQMSYDQRQSFVGLKTGSTQFQFSIFGQLDLAAGVLPGVGF
jgi:hypothetical protein